MTEILPIEVLGETESGRVVELIGPADWQHRLEELGIREGTLVRLIKRGEPCIVGIRDCRISLRFEAGAMLLVEPVDASLSVGN